MLLQRRFPKRLHLPDYTHTELAEICRVVAERRFGKSMESGLQVRALRTNVENCLPTPNPKRSTDLSS